MKWASSLPTAGLIAALLIVAYGQYLQRQKFDGLIIANVSLITALAKAAERAQRACGGRAI